MGLFRHTKNNNIPLIIDLVPKWILESSYKQHNNVNSLFSEHLRRYWLLVIKW